MNIRLLPLLTLALSLALGACGGGKGSTAASDPVVVPPVDPVVPVVPAFTLGAVANVVAGFNSSAVLKARVSGAAQTYLWGDNTWGQMGIGSQVTPSSTPAVVADTATWKAIAAGGSHTLAVKSDGTLWAWGLNQDGQLGDGFSAASGQSHVFQTTPEKIGTSSTWATVAAGEAHSMALDTATSPALYVWGQNTYGQLGLGTTTNIFAPGNTSKIAAASGTSWLAIAAGARHSMALRSDQRILTWGDDSLGQLGDWAAPSNPTLTPTTIIGLSAKALAIAAGSYHSLAIMADHTLWSWGDNAHGQLGYTPAIGTFSAFATQMGTDNDWLAVAGGGSHTLAIKQNQTLWAWGGNAYGQLGNNSTTDAPAPVQIGKASRWVAVAAGKYHSMAIDTDGKLWTWGRNTEGQLGNGTTTGPVLVPTAIP
ncbi:MAG: hypothetical protein HXX19_09345 [Rhodoferax sp.]|nr:hypothetical protein [Rhodoferax sp.]